MSPIDFSDPPDLVIFDFDGTLVDTHASIAHCIARTFSVLAPSTSQQPTPKAIQATIATGAGLEDTFRLLQAEIEQKQEFDMSSWITEYRAIYDKEGLSIVTPYPHAVAILEFLGQHKIKVVVSSNKGVKAIEAVLTIAGLARYVDYVVGDVPGIKRKPDTQSYDEFIAPRFEGLNPEKVLIVGDTEADVLYARAIGAKIAWAKYGYGNKEDIQILAPDYTIESLGELI